MGCECGAGIGAGGGPFAEGRALVEFVLQAHGGAVAVAELPNGGHDIDCQGCGTGFRMGTFVQQCPACGGVHAISPPRVNDPGAVQFAGKDFVLR